MHAAARDRHLDALPNDHGCAGEPEQHPDTGANSIAVAERDSVAVAHPEAHADERTRDTYPAGTRSVLRRR
jgi:hypothetical protein